MGIISSSYASCSKIAYKNTNFPNHPEPVEGVNGEPSVADEAQASGVAQSIVKRPFEESN